MATRRRLAATAAALTISLLAAACGDDKADTSGDKPYNGKVVTIFSSIRDVEATRLETAWAAFEKETGIDIRHEGSGAFEADLTVRVDGGNAPDIAFIPQPGLLATLARDGKVVALPNLKADVEANNIGGWVELGTVDGEFYAPPFGANIKSLVWYSPQAFKDAGYEVPVTWDEMIALSDQIVADGGTPWCVGAGSDQATGWPLTDWVEDAVLRFAGAETYDKWVAHEIPFNDPAILEAIDKVGAIVKNDEYVLNGAESIPSTTFQEAGLPLLDGGCFMHRQASFYGNQFPEGTTKGPDGQVNAFYFPAATADADKPMLGGGEVIAAFNAKPEVEAVVKFLTSAEYANQRLAQGNWLTPNKKADTSLVTDPLEQTFAELLVNSDVFRFDGSDLMPSAVGAGTFWTEMVSWVTGKSTEDAAQAIEDSWPAS
ncbi:MAG: ABC transporter substrate-binding protein [Actinomycetota bacterium]|nr:ABC transporter substrate-binding protein [Actinomycetota bacterium]